MPLYYQTIVATDKKKVSDKVDQINKTELNFFLFFLDLLGII